MKKKIHRILGIGLTLVLAISLSLGMAAPVAADTQEWSAGDEPFDFPDEGSDGDWFWSSDLEEIGPMAQAINGDLYVCAYDDDASVWMLLMSDDGGRTWSATDYEDDVDAQVVDIAVSSEDADVLYVATMGNEVWRTEDAGDSWEEVGEASIGGITGDITSLAVGYSSDTPYVYIGTTTYGAYLGEVWFLEDASFARVWTDLELDTAGYTVDVYTVNTSPFFDDDTEVDILATDGANYTGVLNNIGGSAGAWDEVAELMIDDTAQFESIWASDIVYVADFDDEYEMFVGVVEETFAGLGDVFRVVDGGAYDLSVDDDIVSLDVIGDLGGTSMVAGAIAAAGPAQVYYTTDDGDSWDDADKAPSGNSLTANLVAMADDFDESGIAWCATYTNDSEGGVSMTEDGGDSWNQISLIETDIHWVTDVAMGSPGWMVSVNSGASLWRNDGTNWERVWESSLFDDNMIDLVAVSPESDDVLYVAGCDEMPWGTEPIYRSTDNGQTWDDLVRNPDDISWSDAFLVLDDDTIIVGGEDGEVHKTTRYGRRAWDTEDTDAGDIMSLVASPDVDTDDTLIFGDRNGQVWISEDLGDEWDQVDVTLDAATDTFVAFDPDYSSNGTIFAASGDEIYVCEEVLDDGEWDLLTDDSLGQASGVAVADDGTLYVLDYDEDNGMQRCVDPLGDAEFEMVPTDADDDARLTNMFLTSGSSVIWGIDILSAEVWSYEDTLAVPVVQNLPANNSTSGREGSVIFHWTDLDEADGYQVEIYYQGDLSEDAALDGDPVDTLGVAGNGIADGPVWAVDPEYQGIKMLWRVRVAPGDPVMSKWSDVWTFTTALSQGQWNPFVGGVPESPANGASNVPLMPTFAWNAADWATGYEFVLADNPSFTSAIASETVTTTVFTSETELAYSTAYYWKVRAVSSTSESEWGTGVFTTMDEAPAPPPAPSPQPQPTLTVPAPIQAPPAIPDYLLWTIVGIGAALAIAVIVLIVRTRRTV